MLSVVLYVVFRGRSYARAGCFDVVSSSSHRIIISYNGVAWGIIHQAYVCKNSGKVYGRI